MRWYRRTRSSRPALRQPYISPTRARATFDRGATLPAPRTAPKPLRHARPIERSRTIPIRSRSHSESTQDGAGGGSTETATPTSGRRSGCPIEPPQTNKAENWPKKPNKAMINIVAIPANHPETTALSPTTNRLHRPTPSIPASASVSPLRLFPCISRRGLRNNTSLKTIPIQMNSNAGDTINDKMGDDCGNQ